MMDEEQDITMQKRGYQPGQRVRYASTVPPKTGTILSIDINPYGQETALVQFDDRTYTERVLTATLALIE